MTIHIKEISPEYKYKQISETGTVVIEVNGKSYDIDYNHNETYDEQFSDYDCSNELEIPEELDEYEEEIEDLFEEAYDDQRG